MPPSGQIRPSRNDLQQITRPFHCEYKFTVPNWHTRAEAPAAPICLYLFDLFDNISAMAHGTLDAIGGRARGVSTNEFDSKSTAEHEKSDFGHLIINDAPRNGSVMQRRRE